MQAQGLPPCPRSPLIDSIDCPQIRPHGEGKRSACITCPPKPSPHSLAPPPAPPCTAARPAMDFPTALQELPQEFHLHALPCPALSDQGYQTIADFARAFPSVDRLSAFTTTLPAGSAQPIPGGPGAHTVPSTGAIRNPNGRRKPGPTGRQPALSLGHAFSTFPMDGAPAAPPDTRSRTGYGRPIQGPLSW